MPTEIVFVVFEKAFDNFETDSDTNNQKEVGSTLC